MSRETLPPQFVPFAGMKGVLKKWLLVGLMLAAALSESAAAEEGAPVVCYHTSWAAYRPEPAKFTPENINPNLCTHLIYAYATLNDDNTIAPFDAYQDIDNGGYAKFTALKNANPKLKTVLGIGGGNEGSARFSPLAADPEKRRQLILSVVKVLREHNFDGLDLVWHYPTFRGGKPEDRENHALLVQELRQEFERESQTTGKPRLLISMAIPHNIEYIDNGYNVPNLNKYLDWMTVLGYDFHLSNEPVVDHPMPLYALSTPTAPGYTQDRTLNINYTVQHLIEAGVERKKLLLGIATFGRTFTLSDPQSTAIGARAIAPGEPGGATMARGTLAYNEICSRVASNTEGWTVVQPDPIAMGPYAYKGNQWMAYDDVDIVKKKAQYVVEQGLGGVTFWTVAMDDFQGTCHGKPYPLIEAAKETLHNSLK